jgi:hypothetical protein
MKPALRHLFLISLSLFAWQNEQAIQAQGMIVNEFSNGAAGSQEYIEFLVIGSAANPTGNVDISGWIIDDNNGDFEGSAANVGIAQGHLRIAAGCYTNLPVGAIFLVYNAGDVDPSFPSPDPDDLNGDGVYIVPHTHPCIEICTSIPNSTVPDASYSPCTYQATVSNSWSNAIGFRNLGDAVQSRMPDGTFYHGFSYGDVNAPFPTFHPDLGGGSSFNVAIGTGANTAYIFGCGSLINSTNFIKIPETDATPGRENIGLNGGIVETIRNGTFNYDDFDDPANCPLTFPLELLSFEAIAAENQTNQLIWQVAKTDPNSHVQIQASHNGYQFETIATLALEMQTESKIYYYSDLAQYNTTYYRLEFSEPNAANRFSPIRVASHELKNTISLYPNPTNNSFEVFLPAALSEDSQYEIIDALGKVAQSGHFSANSNRLIVNTSDLAAGSYYFRLQNGKVYNIRAFVKL